MRVCHKTFISQYHDRLAKVLDCNAIVSEELCAGPSVCHRADHGPKHAPGVISGEGPRDSRTDQKNSNRQLAVKQACAKLLDWNGPVTEVLTLRGKHCGPVDEFFNLW